MIGDNMAMDNLKFEIGKSYNIDYVIQELEKAPEVQLGHIVINMTREHKYHVSRTQLQEIAKMVKLAIVKGGKEYEKIGKKFVPLTDITILSIIDPYDKYKKYDKFYVGIDAQIVKAIEEKDQIASPTDAIISEAKKVVEFERDEDLLNGMEIYFKRKGISARPVQDNKYILFEKIGPQTERYVSIREIESTEKEYEKYSAYTKFYEDFYKQITLGMETSKKDKIAAPINAIIVEAQKLGFAVTGNEKGFLKGMELYFKMKKIEIKKSTDEKYIILRKMD